MRDVIPLWHVETFQLVTLTLQQLPWQSARDVICGAWFLQLHSRNAVVLCISIVMHYG